MAVVTMKQLLDSGTHFGHQTRRWNPKMKRFIFTDRNGIYIIDLQQTLTFIDQAYEFVKETVAHGGTVLFVGTKKQAQESVAAEATRVGMPYVNQRWLGGMLTNFSTVHKRLQRLKELEAMEQTGGFEGRTKKEILMLTREKNKLDRSLGGIRDMAKVPSAIWVVDTNKEHIAVGEARKLGIPVIAILDTNCDPDEVDYPIPGNDDAIRSAALLTKVIASAVAEGLQARAGVGRGDGKPEAEAAEPLPNGSRNCSPPPLPAPPPTPLRAPPNQPPLNPPRKAEHWRTSPLPTSSGFGNSPVPACSTARTRWPKATATSTRPSRRSGSRAPRTSASAPSGRRPRVWSPPRAARSSS